MPEHTTDDLIVGIDLGTTNSLIGIVEAGFPLVLADSEGHRLHPSVVHYSEEGAVTVGETARRSATVQPDRTIASVKRLMGQGVDTLPDGERTDHPQAIEKSADSARGGALRLRIDERTAPTPVEVSAEILRHLRTVAEEALEHPVRRAVITVPAYFNNSQREATVRAGEMAGLQVERIINEPTAAALAYGLDRLDESETVAVYDFGGGTFDLSVLRMNDGLFEVLSTAGDTRLGGDDIDAALADFLAEKLTLPEDAARAGRSGLLRAARRAKEQLSTRDSTTASLPFFSGSESYETELSRAEFERVARPVIERTRPLCQRAFAEAAGKGAEEIDHLILVGGSTRIPLVRESLQQWFDKEPRLSEHPDEAIALGAAVQAGILCGRIRQLVLVDVTPLSLGIETFGGLMNVIIPRNTTIPAKAGELFTNAVANQESMRIRVLQGEREMARDNWELGHIELPFQPSPKGSARVGVQFSIDQDGLLEVLARDTATGEDHVLEIRDAAVDVSDESVEKMISESVDHAFEDMNERVWTEALMKSRELLAAVDTALGQVGEHIEADERQAIQTAAEAVRRLADDDTAKDASALKQANAKLDESTQSLAARLVEMAYGEQLPGN